MPPVYGLYTATVPLLVYALLGTSRQLSMGPMAITSLLLGTSAPTFAKVGTSEYITAATNISMVAAIILYLLGTFKLGILANFLSYSVLCGFVTASSLLIAVSQLKYICGIHVPHFEYTHEEIIYYFTHLHESNKWSVIIGLLAWVLLYLVKIWRSRNKPTAERMQSFWFRILIPLTNMASLISILTGSLFAYILIKNNQTIEIIGFVPAGIQSPHFAFTDVTTLINMIPSGFILAIIGFAGNWAVTKRFATMNNYEVDATQELIAQGLCNILGIVFNSFFSSGGLGRTAVNAESGAKTQMATIISAVGMILAIELFTPVFYYIPMTILGAVIEVSVASMIDFEEMVKAYYVDKKDCMVMVITFLITFFIGIPQGVFIGVILSMLFVMNASAFPQIVILGKLPDEEGNYYRDVKRFPKAKQIEHISIVRMDASLFFANSNYFKDKVIEASQGKYHTSQELIQLVILDVSAWIDIDLSGINTLTEIHAELITNHIQLAFACAKGPLRDRLFTAKFIDKLGIQYLCMSIDDAIRSLPRRRSTMYLEREAVTSNYRSPSNLLNTSDHSNSIINSLHSNTIDTQYDHDYIIDNSMDEPYQYNLIINNSAAIQNSDYNTPIQINSKRNLNQIGEEVIHPLHVDTC